MTWHETKTVDRLYAKSHLKPRTIQSFRFAPVRKLCLSRGALFATGGRESGLLNGFLSISHITAAFKLKCRTCPAKAVLISLADNFNFETGLCCPSLETISERCNLSRKGVVKAIKLLEQDGFVKVIRKHRMANHYQLLFTPEALGVHGTLNGVHGTLKQVYMVHSNRKGTRIKPSANKWLSGEAPKSKASQEEIASLTASLRNSVAEYSAP